MKNQKKSWSVAKRADLLIREELSGIFKQAGFKKQRNKFTRKYGYATQMVFFGIYPTESDGKNPPKGKMLCWIRFAPKQTGSYFMRDFIPESKDQWEVPIGPGPKRKKIGKELKKSFQKLIAILDSIKTEKELINFISKKRKTHAR